MISINSEEIVLTFCFLQKYKELWLLRNVKVSLRAGNFLGVFQQEHFTHFFLRGVSLEYGNTSRACENKCRLQPSRLPGFFRHITGIFFRRSLITRRPTKAVVFDVLALSTFDLTEMYITRNLTRRNFRRSLIEANWKSIDRICGMRTIAVLAAITLALRRITDYRSMQMRGTILYGRLIRN